MNHWIRADTVLDDIPSVLPDLDFDPSVQAILQYRGVPLDLPSTEEGANTTLTQMDLSPNPPKPAPQDVALELTLDIFFATDASGINRAYINGGQLYGTPPPSFTLWDVIKGVPLNNCK